MSPRARGAVALCLASAVLLSACSGGAVEVDAPAPDGTAAADCRDFLAALPTELEGLPARELEPAGASARAWGDPAVVVTCGGAMPAGFDEFSSCEVVDGVGWFTPPAVFEDLSATAVVTTVHVEPVVQVSVPAEHRPPAGILVVLAEAVEAELEVTDRCV